MVVMVQTRVEGRREEGVAYVECPLLLSGGEEGEEGCVKSPNLTTQAFKIVFFSISCLQIAQL